MILMLATIACLLIVIILLIATIHRLLNRIDQLTSRLVARRDDQDVNRFAAENEQRRLTNESMANLVSKVTQSVTEAVGQQSSMLQESVKVAWAPQPPPSQIVPRDLMQQLSKKYNLPIADGVVEHDYGRDPTDDYLHEEYTETHMGSVMMPDAGLDSDEPFGIPGLKAVV